MQNIFQLSGVDQIIPTKGFEGAKSYPLGPNSRVALFDDSENVFYVKSTDENGFPTIRVFDYTERLPEEDLKSITINDLKSIIKESIKEELSNGQQFISESRNSTTAVPSFDNANTANTANASKPNSKSHYYTKPRQSKANSSDVANGEE